MDFVKVEVEVEVEVWGGRDVWILGTDTRQHSQSVIRTWRHPSHSSSLTRVLQSSHLCHHLEEDYEDEDDRNMMTSKVLAEAVSVGGLQGGLANQLIAIIASTNIGDIQMNGA